MLSADSPAPEICRLECLGTNLQETARMLQTGAPKGLGYKGRRLHTHHRPEHLPARSEDSGGPDGEQVGCDADQRTEATLEREGRLSESIIDKSRREPATNTYYHRFGSLREAYRLAGYNQWDEYFQRREKAVRTEQLREKLVRDIAEMFPACVSLLHAPPKRRRLLIVDGRIVVSVYLCRPTKWPNGRPCWRLDPVAGETHNVTLLCTSNARNDGVENFYLFRSLGRTGNYKFGPQSKWLAKAKRLTSISGFRDAVKAIDPVSDSKVLNLNAKKRDGAMPRIRR